MWNYWILLHPLDEMQPYHREGIENGRGRVFTWRRCSSRCLFLILLPSSPPPWVLRSISHISFLVRSRYDGELTLAQLARRQQARCCPFLSAGGIKLRTFPCIDLPCSLCLGVVRCDKLFASPAGFISKTVPVWLNAKLFFVTPRDGKWTRDVPIEGVRRFTNEKEENNQYSSWHLQNTHSLWQLHRL